VVSFFPFYLVFFFSLSKRSINKRGFLFLPDSFLNAFRRRHHRDSSLFYSCFILSNPFLRKTTTKTSLPLSVFKKTFEKKKQSFFHKCDPSKK